MHRGAGPCCQTSALVQRHTGGAPSWSWGTGWPYLGVFLDLGSFCLKKGEQGLQGGAAGLFIWKKQEGNEDTAIQHGPQKPVPPALEDNKLPRLPPFPFQGNRAFQLERSRTHTY